MNAVKTVFLLGLLTGLLILVGGALGGRAGLVIAFGLAVVMNGASYWASDRIVLAMHRAQPIAPADDPELHDIVAQLSARAGLPKPRVYLIPSDALNAFATGRDPEHAVVAVTRGIRRALDREEMEGVLAHELSHVKNRDILISSVAATVAGAIMMLAGMARWAAMFGGYGGRDDRRGNGLVQLLATAILAPFAAMLIQMAISRSREFEADRSGAALAGQPFGLARALQKLDRSSKVRPLKSHPATGHLFIVRPLQGGLTRLFSTHPPTRERLLRLVGQPEV
ncbi:MAG: zinc metalloprotease HtpX [Acidobacteriota bacterium]